jgi:hypothetical protein
MDNAGAKHFASDLFRVGGALTDAQVAELNGIVAKAAAVGHAKLVKRVLPVMRVLQMKALLDPFTFHAVVQSDALSQWNAGNLLADNDSTPPQKLFYPEKLIDPFLYKLSQCGVLSHARVADMRFEFLKYASEVEWFAGSVPVPASPRTSSLLSMVGDDDDEPLLKRQRLQFIPKASQEWGNFFEVAQKRTFEGIIGLQRVAIAFSLIEVSEAEVERRFNALRSILADNRKGRLSEDSRMKECIIRGNADLAIERKLVDQFFNSEFK